MTDEQPEVTVCNFTAPIATFGAPRDSYCTLIAHECVGQQLRLTAGHISQSVTVRWRGNQASKMTRHGVGALSIQGVLDQPSQSKLGPVNLQKLCLLAFGDESALLIVDCQDEGGGAHQ